MTRPLQTAATTLKHFPELDGLRGIAILFVISYHYLGYTRFFKWGWTGVDLFFVLSGFLITGKLIQSIGEKDYFLNFYRNRVLRIFPVYYLAIILFYLSIQFLSSPDSLVKLGYYLTHWKGFVFFVQNWTFILYGRPQEKYLEHFWSLAAEEQIYLVWPFVVLWLYPRKKLLPVLVILIFTVPALRTIYYSLYPGNNEAAYYASRADAFSLGALILMLQKQNGHLLKKLTDTLLYVSLVSVGAGIVLFSSFSPFSPFFVTVGYTLSAIFFACLLQKCLQPGGLFSALCRSAVLRYCGKISFGLYIIHWPVHMILGTRISKWAFAHLSENYPFDSFLSLFICLVISFSVSIVSYRYFESYFLGLKKKRQPSAVVAN